MQPVHKAKLARIAMLSMLAVPALGSRVSAQSEPGLDAGAEVEKMTSQVIHFFRKLEADNSDELELHLDSKLFFLGKYPIQPKVEKDEKKEKDDIIGIDPNPIVNAKNLQDDISRGNGLWIAPKDSTKEPRTKVRAQCLHSLANANLEVVSVANDPLLRAVKLGIVRIEGNSRKPLVGSSTNLAAGNGENTPLQDDLKYEDTSFSSAPVFLRGPLVGRTICAGPQGFDRQSALVSISGTISDRSGSYSVKNVFSFVGPEGVPEIDGNEGLRNLLQRQIELTHYSLLQESVSNALTPEFSKKMLEEVSFQQILIARLSKAIGSESNITMPIKNAEDVRRYVIRASYGLTKETVNDLRAYMNALLDRAKAQKNEMDQGYWAKKIQQFEEDLSEVRTRGESGEFLAPVLSDGLGKIDYPWTEFSRVSFVAADTIAGMLAVKRLN